MPRSGRAISIVRSFALAAFVDIALPLASAHAASFDCGKAASERERLICADGQLSSQDSKLGRVDAAKRALLSPAGALLLQKSERSWFDYTQTVCGLRPRRDPGTETRTPSDCLRSAYGDRLRGLARVGRFGPFVLNRVDVYGAKPVTDDSDTSGTEPGFFFAHVAYPQIDAASNAATRDWNAASANRVKIEEPGAEGSDEDTDYEIGLVTARVVSTRWTSFSYGHGAAHGEGVENVWNAVLGRSVRDLTPADLFGERDDWSQRLGDVALKAIEEHGWKPGPPDAEQEVRDDAVSPAEWFLRRDGLVVSFSSYDGGCYACTPQNGLVSWSKLRPIMSSTTLVP